MSIVLRPQIALLRGAAVKDLVRKAKRPTASRSQILRAARTLLDFSQELSFAADKLAKLANEKAEASASSPTAEDFVLWIIHCGKCGKLKESSPFLSSNIRLYFSIIRANTILGSAIEAELPEIMNRLRRRGWVVQRPDGDYDDSNLVLCLAVTEAGEARLKKLTRPQDGATPFIETILPSAVRQVKAEPEIMALFRAIDCGVNNRAYRELKLKFPKRDNDELMGLVKRTPKMWSLTDVGRSIWDLANRKY